MSDVFNNHTENEAEGENGDKKDNLDKEGIKLNFNSSISSPILTQGQNEAFPYTRYDPQQGRHFLKRETITDPNISSGGYGNGGSTPKSKRNIPSVSLRQSKYDKQKIPPDFDKAMEHRLATSVGPEKDIKDLKEGEDINYCGCCARQIQRKQLSFKCNNYELSFLGSGYPLYFQFMKQCIILLFFVLFFSGIFNVITNFIGNTQCNPSSNAQQTASNLDSPSAIVCSDSNWVNIFSIGSKSDQKELMSIQGYLNLTCLVAMIILLQFSRKLQRQLDSKCDSEDISANDYTIMVQDIPKVIDAVNDDYDDDLLEFFQKNGLEGRELNVKSVTLCYNLEELEKLNKKKISLIEKKKELIQLKQCIQKKIETYNSKNDQNKKNEKEFLGVNQNNKQKQLNQEETKEYQSPNQLKSQKIQLQTSHFENKQSSQQPGQQNNKYNSIIIKKQFNSIPFTSLEQEAPQETEQEQIESNDNNYINLNQVEFVPTQPFETDHSAKQDETSLVRNIYNKNNFDAQEKKSLQKGILSEGEAQIFPSFQMSSLGQRKLSQDQRMPQFQINKIEENQGLLKNKDNFKFDKQQNEKSQGPIVKSLELIPSPRTFDIKKQIHLNISSPIQTEEEENKNNAPQLSHHIFNENSYNPNYKDEKMKESKIIKNSLSNNNLQTYTFSKREISHSDLSAENFVIQQNQLIQSIQSNQSDKSVQNPNNIIKSQNQKDSKNTLLNNSSTNQKQNVKSKEGESSGSGSSSTNSKKQNDNIQNKSYNQIKLQQQQNEKLIITELQRPKEQIGSTNNEQIGSECNAHLLESNWPSMPLNYQNQNAIIQHKILDSSQIGINPNIQTTNQNVEFNTNFNNPFNNSNYTQINNKKSQQQQTFSQQFMSNTNNNMFQNTINIHQNNVISINNGNNYSNNNNTGNLININNNNITININNNININNLILTNTGNPSDCLQINPTFINQSGALQQLKPEVQSMVLKQLNQNQKLYDKQIQKQKKILLKIEEQSRIMKEIENNVASIENQISHIVNQTKNLKSKLMDGKGKDFMKKYFTGNAFICFRYEQDKEEIIERYRPINCEDKLVSKEELTQQNMIYHSQRLKILQAPDPTDVNWMNLHYSKQEKFKRRCMSFLFTTASLLVCAAAIYAFHIIQESQSDTSDTGSFKMQIISSVLAVFISILNVLLANILKVASKACKYSTQTEINIFISKGLSIARFINSAIINFIIQIFVQTKSKQQSLFGPGGLADNANYFMISNCFIPAIAQLVNVQYYLMVVMRKLEFKKGDQSFLTQLELNEQHNSQSDQYLLIFMVRLYENPVFHIEERYAQLLMTMFTTAFYCPIVPMTIIWSLIGILLQYWVDKYNLIYRCSVKYNMSAALSIEMTEHLEYFLPIQSLSTLIFYQYANGGEWALSSIIGTALGCLHAFLPMQLINERFFLVDKAEANTIDYEEAEGFFITDYSRENPIYREKARESHVKRMTIKVNNQKTILQSAVKNTMKTNNLVKNLKTLKGITSLAKSFKRDVSNIKEEQEPQSVENNPENSSKDKRNLFLINAQTQETFQTNDEMIDGANKQLSCQIFNEANQLIILEEDSNQQASKLLSQASKQLSSAIQEKDIFQEYLMSPNTKKQNPSMFGLNHSNWENLPPLITGPSKNKASMIKVLKKSDDVESPVLLFNRKFSQSIDLTKTERDSFFINYPVNKFQSIRNIENYSDSKLKPSNRQKQKMSSMHLRRSSSNDNKFLK